jgi:uracil-xanthine permease
MSTPPEEDGESMTPPIGASGQSPNSSIVIHDLSASKEATSPTESDGRRGGGFVAWIDSIWTPIDDSQLGVVVMPRERMGFAKTAAMGAQHCIAMFGGTILVPLLIHSDPACALFFSGVATLLFLAVTGNRVPSYLGSSFAFVAPALAAHSQAEAQSGFVATGVAFAAVGVLVHVLGDRAIRCIDRVMPPVVTGTVIAIIGLNLAPVAKAEFNDDPLTGAVTAFIIAALIIVDRGLVSRLSVFAGVVVGTVFAASLGRSDFAKVSHASWIGLPHFQLPVFSLRAVTMTLPAIVVIIAENVGHVKAVAAMTGENLDPFLGRSFIGDGVSTVIAGLFGGIGTTTYAENIGVMAATRVYSTLVYVVAAFAAIALSLCPKIGAIVDSIPRAVVGGAATVLYGLIVVLGIRLFVEDQTDFRHPVKLALVGACIIIGAADFTVDVGGLAFGGIGVGCICAVVLLPLGELAHKAINGDRPPPSSPRTPGH